jgi:hypothetical protein
VVLHIFFIIQGTEFIPDHFTVAKETSICLWEAVILSCSGIPPAGHCSNTFVPPIAASACQASHPLFSVFHLRFVKGYYLKDCMLTGVSKACLVLLVAAGLKIWFLFWHILKLRHMNDNTGMAISYGWIVCNKTLL